MRIRGGPEVNMAEQEKGPWVIVAILFATMFLIWGPVNASGVFFVPVVKHFGWSRALFSALVATAPLAAGISSPLVGSLLDRVGARRVMVAGAAMVAAGYAALSRANSVSAFFLVFIVLGVGITCSTIIPSAIVITRRFRERRGVALGLVFSGIPLGGTGMTIFANYMILHYGFRAGYLAMAVAIIVVVIPLLALFLPARAAREERGAVQEAAADLRGLEVREALKSRSFWMIAIAEVFFATGGVGIRVHLVAYLTGMGYGPTLAAEILGAMFMISAIGSFTIGRLADKLGGRVALSGVFISAAIGIAILIGASHTIAVAAFLAAFGLTLETPRVLVPIVIGESLGTSRLGALLGIQAFFNTLGFAAGPVIAGRIFDVSGSYFGALVLFTGMAAVSALAIRATLPLAEERARTMMGAAAVESTRMHVHADI